MDEKLDLVVEALETARKNGFASVEVEAENISFSGVLSPRAPKRPKSEASAESLPKAARILKSPMVGYYQSPPHALAAGMEVDPDTTAAVISVFGIANEVKAGIFGVVEEILAEEGEAVEYGHPLMTIRETVGQ